MNKWHWLTVIQNTIFVSKCLYVSAIPVSTSSATRPVINAYRAKKVISVPFCAELNSMHLVWGFTENVVIQTGEYH